MRILVCTSSAPLPPLDGFRLTLRAVLEQLARRHELQIVGYLARDQQAGEAPNGMRLLPTPVHHPLRDAPAIASSLLRRRPIRADALAEGLREPLRQEIERFRPDVVHVTSGRLAALGASLAGSPTVLVALDAWHLNLEAMALTAGPLRRRLLRFEARTVRRFQAQEYGRFGRVVVVTEQDAAALREGDPRLDVAVIPNGVDATVYAPDPGVARVPGRIVFTGLMGYPPNVTTAEFLARRVLPLVRVRFAQAHLVIVGRDPAPSVQALAGLEGVQVTGEVPEVQPWLNGARAFACPMRSGTGIKNKLLEAMACRTACVATPLAVQGLGVEHEVEVLVGQTAEELAGHLHRLLTDDALAERLGRASREYVERHHDWRAVARAYERVYEEARAGRAAR